MLNFKCSMFVSGKRSHKLSKVIKAWVVVSCLLLSGIASAAASPEFSDFFEQQNVPLLWIDPSNGKIVDANPAAAEFYGFGRDALQQMSIQQINTFDAAQVAEEMQAAKAAGRNYFIFRHELADGEIRTVEVYSKPYEREGKRLLLSVIHDITPGRNLDQGMWHYQKRLEELVTARTEQATLQNRRIIMLLVTGLVLSLVFASAMAVLMRKRRRAERESQRFKAIADSALYGSAISDLEGNVVYVNPFFAELHGYSAEELEGKTFGLFHNEDQMPQVIDFYRKVAEQGQFSTSAAIWHSHRDGTTFPMLMSSSVLKDKQGKAQYLATTALDLTEQYRERQHSEQVLIEAREAAEAASQAKSDFLANMSHEIRTPLNAIIGLSEFQLSSPKLNDETREHLQQIHNSGQLLLGIVNDLLDFSRIEKNQMTLVQKPFSLQQVLKQLSTLFALSSSEKGLELILNLPSTIPHSYSGDQQRLTQVLTNLMSNAVKFTEKGLVELEIRAQELKETSAVLRFILKDSGVGMTPEQQKGVFQAFTQADSSITRRHGGTGLGLIISHRLVQLMGSDKGIGLDSAAGVGSCFYFDLELPYAEQEKAAELPVSCSQEPCRALVVDDQSVARKILREILESWGFLVTEAGDGDEAVSQVEAALQKGRPYDLILMDWEMPRMNGLAALQTIKGILNERGYRKNLPSMLMVSAYERSEIDLDSIDNVLYLPKPVHQSNLYNALESLQKRFAHTGDIQTQQVFCQQSVLIVEDNLVNQQVVQAILGPMNLNISLANNGQEAVELVKRHRFDLVLMDIQMPVMDGYQATREIRCFNQEIPIIALTAAALVEDREKALEVGMNDHLGKPFSAQQLFERMAVWLKTEMPPLKGIESKTPSPETVPVETLSESVTRVSGDAPLELNQKQTVLIVDDVPANVKILASLLKDDYVVQVANRGEKALAIAQGENPPDLILLDIMMPDIDGYEVCRRLKASTETSRIPVIFVSALDEVSDEANGLNLGAVDYITKPYHPDIVKARVKSHMSLKQKTDLLEDMSNIDGLTQVANRRYLDSRLKSEISRLQRSHSTLSLVMLDIDHFKAFNDNYGHGRGDDCLIRVASILKRVVHRPGDLFARYGGEEFVAILPETDREGGQRVAEAMRKAVESAAIPHEHSTTSDVVTISLGVVSRVVASESVDTFLELADKALYQAKGTGRNRVVVSE